MVVGMMPQKEDSSEIASEGWRSEDGSLSWGYSSFRGKRVTMEDFYDMKTDVDFLDSERDTFRDDGSTASTAVLVGNHMYVANVGDSRSVISKAGKAIALSEDHKPNRIDERKRIESAGGIVMWAGTWRVGGVLAMSRAFGNSMLKQFVVAEPEIQEVEIGEELELLVVASDGHWEGRHTRQGLPIIMISDGVQPDIRSEYSLLGPCSRKQLRSR
ncbi:hypothetical protein MLD38_002910 [Melastoma candidum]|uniref:Uncharacterized protein n=1 Tax=Melastoma candidum TaxID=119954 RepID=A0ACB9S0N0_9MYRT|nr:hypothetical protein MLD38_002910 [Melastoma candidum]